MEGFDLSVIPNTTATSNGWSALSGFLVSGFLVSLVGALLPVWGFDVASDYALAGRHFLSIVLGVITAGSLIRGSRRLSTRTLLIAGCALATVGLVGLAEFSTGVSWRLGLIFLIGLAIGLLHSGLFRAILPAYDEAPARTLNRAGIFFGGGCILCALLVAGIYWAFSIQSILLLLSAFPAVFAVLYANRIYPAHRITSHPQVLKQFRSGAAILFASLLFFQFGNEWSIAAWLPLFLIHRLGMSPVGALQMLAFYFAALTAGRLGIAYLIPVAAPRRKLAVGAAASLAGCMLLAATNNRLGATVAILLLGFGFAPVYPLLATWIGKRFPFYHPGFFSGIFSIALAGGMLTPWILGEIAAHAGIWTIITLPAIGTCMVVLLLCLIWIEQRVTGE